jgi:hypothetical protein
MILPNLLYPPPASSPAHELLDLEKFTTHEEIDASNSLSDGGVKRDTIHERDLATDQKKKKKKRG